MNHTPQEMKFPHALLFDYDGVLVASEPIHLSAWLQLLDELGLPQDNEIIQRNVGKTAPEILAVLLNQYKPGWNPEKYNVHELAQRKNLFYLSLAHQGLQVYPGVIEGLKWLKSLNIPTAVVSNARGRELRKTMSNLGLTEYFTEIISRDDAKAAKPDPTPYLMGANLLGFDPSDCMAIEDSPTGLEAALLAKIPAAAIMTNFPRYELEQPVPGRPDLMPAWIGPSIQNFFQWLRELKGGS